MVESAARHFSQYNHHGAVNYGSIIMPYPVDVGSKLAGEDEAVDALLKARDVHDLQEVALHSAQLLGVAHPHVLGVFPLHRQRVASIIVMTSNCTGLAARSAHVLCCCHFMPELR